VRTVRNVRSTGFPAGATRDGTVLDAAPAFDIVDRIVRIL
jgi:hypothetical protein